MNIAVCVKQTPDTEAKIEIQGKTSLNESGFKFIISPYCEFAVEEALLQKEKHGGETTVVSVGQEKVLEAIRTALAMGIDKAVHLNDGVYDGGDNYSTAVALAGALKKVDADLILGGKQAIDDDSAQTMTLVAEMMDIPHVNIVAGDLSIDPDAKKGTAKRRIEGGDELVEFSLPVIITCEKGLNEPRYASLPGIMKAKKKAVDNWNPGDLGVGNDDVGASGAKVKHLRYEPLPERAAGKILEGEPAEVAKELARLLREEAKVI